MEKWFSDIVSLGSLSILATIFFKYFENRRKEKEYLNKRKEAATLIYCELIYNFSKMMKTSINERFDLLVIEDWKNKISTLHEVLDISEMKSLYDLYNFFIFHNNNNNNKGNNCEYDKIINKIFIEEFLQYKFLDFGEDPIGFLSDKYFQILERLENVVSSENSHCKRKTFEIDWNKTIKKYYLENGDLLYAFTYKDKKIINGELNYYTNGELKSLFNCSFTEEKIQKTGYVTQFDEILKQPKYIGSILNKLYHGEGNLFLTQGYKFKGIFENNNKKSGIEDTYKYKFEGKFENNELYSGDIEAKNNSYKYKNIYGLKGEIFEGEIISGEGYLEIDQHRYDDGAPEWEPNYTAEELEEHLRRSNKDQISEFLDNKLNDLIRTQCHATEILKCNIESRIVTQCDNNIFNKDYV